MSDSFVSKIYIDTRLKTLDSISNTDFRFQLSRGTHMPVGSTFCIDELNIPHSWNTIEAGVNDKVYVSWQVAPAVLTYATITLPPKRYNGADLAAQIQAQINATSGFTAWIVSYDSTLNTITFSGNLSVFKIWTDEDLAITTFFPGLNNQNPQSINDIFQIYGKTTGYVNNTITPFTTGFLNLLNYQDLYLTSANLGNFDVLGARGEGSVIRKICVNAAWGFSIIDKSAWDSDQMSCSKLSLSTIDFQLRDVRGRVVSLHGGHISFTIKFKT